MKTNIKIAVMTLALGFSAFATTSVLQAGTVETTKGERISVEASTPLRTLEDFKSLRKGDKVSVHCPMMKETVVTTIRNVDSKGHAVIRETGKVYKIGTCNIVLKKVAGSKEVQSFMVCPDGTLTPAECSKM